jgi:lauroyl/myristoyl acyltransferase
MVFSFIFRGGERLFSPAVFHRILWPFFKVRARLYVAFRREKPAPLPDFLQTGQTRQSRTSYRAGFYINRIPDYFSERLAGPKWRNRCQVEGLEHLLAARKSGRPVVLAYCHFGAYFLLRAWMEAAGFPAGGFKVGKTPERSRLNLFVDRTCKGYKSQFRFWEDEWNQAAGFMKAGNSLFIAMDMPRGEQVSVPLMDGWNFQMSTLAMRVAGREGAEVIPCWIINDGVWNFRMKLGAPVPRNYLTPDSDLLRAGKHLIDEMLLDFRAHPEQCSGNILECIKPVPN